MKKNDLRDGFFGWMLILAFLVGGFLISKVVTSGFEKGSEYLDDRSDKKEECAERAEDASNSYAAKKLYKACMKK